MGCIEKEIITLTPIISFIEEMKKIDITADDILNYFKHGYMNRNYTLGISEFCPYMCGRRIDMFYFNRWNRETKGYEIKVSRQDFLQDDKWQLYLPYCTYFYFVAPEGIIKPEELPEKIGLCEIVLEDKSKSWNFAHEYEEGEEAYELNHKFTKKPKKLGTVSEEKYIELLEGLLIKLVYNKNLLT